MLLCFIEDGLHCKESKECKDGIGGDSHDHSVPSVHSIPDDIVHWDMIDGFLKEIGLYDFKVMIGHVCMFAFEGAGVKLTATEERILNDVLSPEFKDDGSGPLFKLRRWMANRWKHRLVYNENLMTMFITLAWSHLRKPKI